MEILLGSNFINEKLLEVTNKGNINKKIIYVIINMHFNYFRATSEYWGLEKYFGSKDDT